MCATYTFVYKRGMCQAITYNAGAEWVACIGTGSTDSSFIDSRVGALHQLFDAQQPPVQLQPVPIAQGAECVWTTHI